MMHIVLIDWLEDESNANDTWTERVKRYDAQARDDFAMYAWMEQNGKLPPPHRIGPGTVRKWQQVKAAQS